MNSSQDRFVGQESFAGQDRFASQEPFAGNSGNDSFEATLRLIAHLPAPDGLAERVQAELQASLQAHAGQLTLAARLRAWFTAPWQDANGMQSSWMQSSWARALAAAAIVAVVVAGGWSICSRVPPPQSARGIVLPVRVAGQGGFSSAGAMRTPQTLNGPIVEHPQATPTATVPVTPEPLLQTPNPQAKSVATKLTAAQPVTPATK
jgi:hypothetical protein